MGDMGLYVIVMWEAQKNWQEMLGKIGRGREKWIKKLNNVKEKRKRGGGTEREGEEG